MSVFSRPTVVDKPDERLRILWIEDRETMFPTNLGTAAEKTIQIIGADSAVEVWKILKDPGHSEFLRQGFDVYITDFHLTANMQSSESEAPGTFQPRPKDGTPLSNADLGANARSAGFLIGVMFASHFPTQPAIVLPYSQFDEQFGDVWRLVSHFSAENVQILDQNLYNKTDTSRADLYPIASRSYREMLSSWVEDGQISLRSDELNRLLAYREEIISDKETITLIGTGRARRLKIVALFLDHDEITDDGIPARVVREFIDGLPAMDLEQRDARRLAEQFIKDAESEPSVQLYNKVYGQRDAGQPALYHKMPPTKPYLGINEAGPIIDRRNAFLILCVYIHAKYVLPYQLLSSFEENEESMEDEWTIAKVTKMVCEKYRLDLFPLISEGVEELLRSTELGDKGNFVLAMDILSGRPKGSAHWERLIRRYVEPFPQQAGDIQGSIPLDSRIGVGLRRLLDSTDDAALEVALPRRTSNRLQGIFDGRQCLDRARLRVARAYAREQLPQTSWPEWLSPI